MKYTISGFTCENEAFTETVEFTLIPPQENEPHYGTGYYMTVKTPTQKHFIDVRYERTTDIETLADRWVKNWYGDNATQIIKCINRGVNA